MTNEARTDGAETGGAALEAGARRVVERLAAAGHRALWAGGCVRDRLLGRAPKDIDVATDATPDQVLALFPRSIAVGRAFGVVVVRQAGQDFEVATFRAESDYRDGRRPDTVHFTDERGDARRRDFTINGMFYDPFADRVLDYVGGRDDLAARLVRTIGDPDERFGEDHLRLLRAVRFASVLPFGIEERTAAAIRRLAPMIRRVSAERVQGELTRLLTESPRAGQGVLLLHRLGLLAEVLPEVAALAEQDQPPEFHPEGDVLTHTALMLDTMERPSAKLAYAVLLHDVGKPPTAHVGPAAGGVGRRLRFDEHDRVGAEMAEAILRRLRMPSRMIEAVTHCIRNHMRFMHVAEMREAKLRRLVGAESYPVERELHRLDCLASHGDTSNLDFLDTFVDRLRAEPVLPPPLVTGHDVLALGVPEGPEVGRLLREVYEEQLERPDPTREELLARLRERAEGGRSGQ